MYYKGRYGYSLGTLGNCTLLSSKTSLFKFNFCSLSTFPQVIATGTAVSVGVLLAISPDN